MFIYDLYLLIRDQNPYLVSVITAIHANFVLALFLSLGYFESLISVGMKKFAKILAIVLGVIGLPFFVRHLLYIVLRPFDIFHNGFTQFLLHLFWTAVGLCIGIIPLLLFRLFNSTRMANSPAMDRICHEMASAPDAKMICCDDGVYITSDDIPGLSVYQDVDVQYQDLYDALKPTKSCVSEFRGSVGQAIRFDSAASPSPAFVSAADIATSFCQRNKGYKKQTYKKSIFFTENDFTNRKILSEVVVISKKER